MTQIHIATDRTILCLIKSSDLKSIHELHSLPETDKFNTLGIPENINETRATIEPWIAENQSRDAKNFTFAIEKKVDSRFIGLFGLRLGPGKYRRGEVWYKLYPDYWNKGYATESAKACIKFGFDKLELPKIVGRAYIENKASIEVLKKCNFKFDKNFMYDKRAAVLYTIINDRS